MPFCLRSLCRADFSFFVAAFAGWLMVFLQRVHECVLDWSGGSSGRRDLALAGIFALVPARAAAALCIGVRRSVFVSCQCFLFSIFPQTHVSMAALYEMRAPLAASSYGSYRSCRAGCELFKLCSSFYLREARSHVRATVPSYVHSSALVFSVLVK